MPPRQTISADTAAKVSALDDKIHDLLVRRAKLAPPATPAQQAVTLRRLAARHTGDLPLPVLVSIWRELMAASATGTRTVHVYSADRAGQFRDLARDLFGSVVTMQSHASASAIVAECGNDPSAFGVVPPPESDENGRPWWTQLTPAGQPGPRIVAVLPLVGEERPQAYVIGTTSEPEASGEDTSVLLLEADDTLSLSRMQALLKQGGLDARLVAVGRDGNRRQNLLEVSGMVTQGDSRLGALIEQAADTILRIAPVGCYANPLVTAEETAAE